MNVYGLNEGDKAQSEGRLRDCPESAGSAGEYFYGFDGAVTCRLCGCESEAEECEYCEDGLSHHDCGEDCCCCADPWPNVPCDMCNGKGYTHYCENPDCEAFTLYRHVPLQNSED